MLENSPLLFLDYDIAQYIYETYYPSDKAKGHKKRLNHDFLDNVQRFKLKYKVDTIYDNEIMLCVRGSLYKRVSFFLFINEKNYTKVKTSYHYLFHNILLRSHDRANQLKNEALYLKKIINHIC